MTRTTSRSSYRGVVATLGRLALVGAVVLAAAGSAAQNQSNAGPSAPSPDGAPQPISMAPSNALGLWKSSFGAVKIEDDLSRGQPGSGAIMGVWVYDRGGQEVIGYFAGSLRGNVLDFTWQEPADPVPLQGAGYITFAPDGSRFSGRWWSTARDRSGEWSGWRQQTVPSSADPSQPQPQSDDGYDDLENGEPGGTEPGVDYR